MSTTQEEPGFDAVIVNTELSPKDENPMRIQITTQQTSQSSSTRQLTQQQFNGASNNNPAQHSQSLIQSHITSSQPSNKSQLPATITSYLPNGKIPTFEEQLQLDQQRQQLINQRQHQMIQNLQFAKSNFKKKSTSVSMGQNRLVRGQTTVMNLLRGPTQRLQSQYSASSREMVNTADFRNIQQHKKNHNGYIHQHSHSSIDSTSQNKFEFKRNSVNSQIALYRKPNYTLAFSASGQLLPRRMVQKQMPQMHNFGDLMEKESNYTHSNSSTIPVFHGRHMSVDPTQANSSSFHRHNAYDVRNHDSMLDQNKNTSGNSTLVLLNNSYQLHEKHVSVQNLKRAQAQKHHVKHASMLTTLGHRDQHQGSSEDRIVGSSAMGDHFDSQSSLLPKIQQVNQSLSTAYDMKNRFNLSTAVVKPSLLKSGLKHQTVASHKADKTMKKHSDQGSYYSHPRKSIAAQPILKLEKTGTVQAQEKSVNFVDNEASPREHNPALLSASSAADSKAETDQIIKIEDNQESAEVDLSDQLEVSLSRQIAMKLSAKKNGKTEGEQPASSQQQPIEMNKKPLLEGPSTKKFKVLASIMASDLNKQYSKHFVGPVNQNQRIRLRQEFSQVYKKKTQDIRNALKPVKYRDLSQPLGKVKSSNASSKADSREKNRISYQTSSDGSSLPDQQSEDVPDTVSSDEDIFDKTKTPAERGVSVALQRRGRPIKEPQYDPEKEPRILPHGMTKQTLFDDKLFEKWFDECFRTQPPSKEELIQKQMRKNARKAKRRKERLENQKRAQALKDDLDMGYSTESQPENDGDDSDDSSIDYVSAQNKSAKHEQDYLLDIKKSQSTKQGSTLTTGNDLDEMILKEQARNRIYDPRNAELVLQSQQSDRELRDTVNVEKLIRQIKQPEEDFTLNLTHEMQEILEFFKVTIKGTKEKRHAKRTRLTNHFMRQYHKFFKMEMEWAYFEYGNLLQFLPPDETDQALNETFYRESANQRKKIKNSMKAQLREETREQYLERMERKQNDLMLQMRRMGEESQKILMQRHEEKVLSKLLDTEQEIAEQNILEQRGKALQELFEDQGLSKQTNDFQNSQQPHRELEEVKLEPNVKESMSPQRKFVASKFGHLLIDEMQTNQSKREKSYENLVNRRSGLGKGGSSHIELETVFLARSKQLMKQAQAIDAFISSSPFKTPTKYSDVNSLKKTEQLSAAAASKKQKMSRIEQRLEVSDQLEVFQESKLREEYYKSLREKKQNEHDRDAKINSDYSNFCILNQNVHDLPVFARIKNNQLSLSGYKLNSGVCKALGIYLAQSNWRIDKSFLLKELVLDNNGTTDADFAEILSGVCIQGQLQQLTYARNNFGIESVHQIERIIQQQSKNRLATYMSLSQIRLIGIKTSPEVLSHLFTTSLPQMQNLTQLRLKGIPLITKELSDDLVTGILKHKDHLELLDLQDTQLNVEQLELITSELQKFKELHSLDVSYNNLRQVSDQLVSNLCNLVTMESKLNHISISYMHLGFKACSAIAQAASKSQSLCALHMSGNKLDRFQQKFILRILGIRESEIETSEEQMNRISVDEVKLAIFNEDGSERQDRSPSWTAVGSEQRRTQFSRQSQARQSTMDRAKADPVIQNNLEEMTRPSWDKAYPRPQVVNSYAAKANQLNIAKVHSLQDGQVYQRVKFDNLVFTRQVYNPELFFNQDSNKDDLLHDPEGPFTWHVNFKFDGCYICQQWRYCILFFSRKQVIESNFFSPVDAGNARVSLDKLCGFTNELKEQYHNDSPWLIGTFTALSKSQFMPVKDYTNLLQHRLKKSRFLKANKAIKQSLNKRIAGFFSGPSSKSQSTTKLKFGSSEAADGQSEEDRSSEQSKQQEAKPQSRRFFRKSSTLITQASIKHQMSLKWQSLVDGGDESSDFSIDEQSTLLELLQKLKKVDPEVLILNYRSSVNKGDAANEGSPRSSLQVDDLDSGDSKSEQPKKHNDFYVFAAYVPPGKHLLLLRDVGTTQYKQNQKSRAGVSKVKAIGPVKHQYNTNTAASRESSKRDHRPEPRLRKSVLPSYESSKNNTEQSPLSANQPGLMRLGKVSVEKSEYYHKELFIEPRENQVFKTYCKPFSFQKLPKMSFKMKSGIISRELSSDELIQSNRGTQVRHESVFRDWIEETEQVRSDFFELEIVQKLRIEQNNHSSTNEAQDSPDSSPRAISTRRSGRSIKPIEIESQSPFQCLFGMAGEIKQVLWANFEATREFFYELSAMDQFSYPQLKMLQFSHLCQTKGKNYLHATLKPAIEHQRTLKSQNSSRKNKSSPEKGRKSKADRSQNKKGSAEEDFYQEPDRPKQLYTIDLQSPLHQMLLNKRSRMITTGEFRQSLKDTLMVDLVGFIAHLLKIAIIWSNGADDGIKSVPEILAQLLSRDIPLMRRLINWELRQVTQAYQNVSLPYEIDQFKNDELAKSLKPMLNSHFRHRVIIADENVNKVLKTFQQALISIFMLLSSKATQKFEFDSCSTIRWSATLAGFRVPKKKPAKKPTLKKLIQTAMANEAALAEAGAEPPASALPILSLPEVQFCFTRSKMLGSAEAEYRNKKNKLVRSPPKRKFAKRDSSLERDDVTSLRIQKRIEKIYKPNELTSVSLEKPVDFRRLSFVEWLEFLCRVAACIHVIDAKTASKTKNPALLRLIEDSRKPFSVQLASFLSVSLKQILVNYGKALPLGKAMQLEGELQAIYEHVHDFDDVIESMDEAGEIH